MTRGSDDPLGAVVRAAAPADPDARVCWGLLERAVEVGWVDADDLRICVVELPRGNDRGYAEFGLQPYGDVLEVSFLDERYRCATRLFVDAMRLVAARLSGTSATR